MHRFWFALSLVALVACFPSGCSSEATAPKPFCEAGMTSVHLALIDSVLVNPGMGCESFNRSGDAAIDSAGWYPKTSIAYYRWYWNQIEPQDGVVDFALIDGAIRQAAQCGQTFAFRIMCANGESNPIPEWLQGKIPGVAYENGFVPDFNDSIFLRYSIRLINALGQRYNGSDLIDHIDIGTVGLWGEWHVAGVQNAVPIKLSTCWEVIDAYHSAFSHTTLLMPINSVGGLMHAKDLGIGWRADCWGDIGGFSKTWNHMRDMYPVHMANAGIEDQWKIAPVALETCWDIRHWLEQGWDITPILQYATDVHASIINAKSIGIPVEIRPQIEGLLKQLGYRLQIEDVCHTAVLAKGGALTIRGRWTNAGVAPPYKPFQIAYRLRSTEGRTAWNATSDAKVGAWLPGSRVVTEQFTLPSDIPAGSYTLQVSIQEPRNHIPVVHLANAGRLSDGWYPVSTLTVQ